MILRLRYIDDVISIPELGMRRLLLFAGLWFTSIAGAAGLAGTYVLQGQQGAIVAKIEVRGAALTGTIDLAGQGTMKLTGTVTGNRARGAVASSDGALFILGQNGQWNRVGTYGMTDDGSTMRITYNGGGRKLWSRQ